MKAHVRELLEKVQSTADFLHQRGEFGFTALRVADEFEHSLLVEYLLASGAAPSALDAPAIFDRDANARHVNSLREQIKRLEGDVSQCASNAPGSGT
jgi:hypothetical protein